MAKRRKSTRWKEIACYDCGMKIQQTNATITRLTRERNEARETAETLADLYLNAEEPGPVVRPTDPNNPYQLYGGVPTWVTRDGTVLSMSMMDDSHLINVICFLQRGLVYAMGTARYLRSYAGRFRLISDLLHEAERRGLDV